LQPEKAADFWLSKISEIESHYQAELKIADERWKVAEDKLKDYE
jgi:hypothetical protein